jgi:hypothetical protein
MNRLLAVLTIILGLALIVSVILGRKTQRKLQQEMHTVTNANGVLRETLGQLTIAITNKDKQIDRLLSSPCKVPQGENPDSRRVPPLRKFGPAKHSSRTSIGAN